MLLTIALILVGLWALASLVFHVTVAAVHLLIVAAVVAIAVHFAKRSKTGAKG